MIFHSKKILQIIPAHRRDKFFLCAVFVIVCLFPILSFSQSQNISLLTTPTLSYNAEISTDNNSLFPLDSQTFSERSNEFLDSHIIRYTYGGIVLITQSIAYKKYDVNIRDLRLRYLDDFLYDYDTYLQFVPTGVTFILKGLGFKSRSSWGELIVASALSYGVGIGFTKLIKENVTELRPDGGGFNSFPSGHTATAFIGASILAKEYKETYPWITILGYTASSVTGLSRILNHRHWLHDVFMGAGLGILSTEFSYAITDAIFNRKDAPSFRFQDVDYMHEKPSYANFFFSYNCLLSASNQKLSDNTEYTIHNGIGVGMEGAYFFTPNIGINLRGKIDSYMAEHQNISTAEDSAMFVKSIEVGPTFAMPLYNRLVMGSRLGFGLEHLDENQLQDDIPIQSQVNFQFSWGLYFNIWMEKYTYLRLFADTQFSSIKIEDERRSFHNLCLGMSIGWHF